MLVFVVLGMPGVAGVYSSDEGAVISIVNTTYNKTKELKCHPGGYTESTVVFTSAIIGIGANIILMGTILSRKSTRM